MMIRIAHALATGAVLWALAASAPANAQVNLDVVIGVAPPVVVAEPPPPPRVGFVWAPGFWAWDGYRHVWQGGHWEPVREGELYVAPQWAQVPGGWRLVPGHWEHHRHFRHHDDDDDHDGDFCPPGQAKKGRC